MNEIIAIIQQATKQLGMLRMEGIEEKRPTARDWSGLFTALVAFAQKLLPLILPLFALADDSN